MTEISVQIFDATATCPVTWGRDGWELDSPETETSIEGFWVDPDKIQIQGKDGQWRTLTQLLIDAAERCDQPRPENFGDDTKYDHAAE